MDRDEIEDGEGAIAVVVLAGGSRIDVWADGVTVPAMGANVVVL